MWSMIRFPTPQSHEWTTIYPLSESHLPTQDENCLNKSHPFQEGSTLHVASYHWAFGLKIKNLFWPLKSSQDEAIEKFCY